MNRFFCCWLIVASSLWVNTSLAASVIFLNPGSATDNYWASYSKFMQTAAERLGMSLTVLYSDRDTRTLLDLARDSLQGPTRPDYLVFSNELNVAPEILRLSQGSGVKLFLVNNTLTASQTEILGDVPSRYPDLIGSLIGNDEEGGYLIANQLMSLHPPLAAGESIEMLAFSGTNTTPVSLRREQGMYRALAEHPEVHLRQIVLGGWRRDRALEQARVLLKRYPQVKLIWAASDQMAYGAMDAVREVGKQPGKDVLFATINGSPEALKALAEGTLNVLAVGHIAIGGWAMLLLHDYDRARIAERLNPGARQVRVLKLLSAGDVPGFVASNKRADRGIDVRQYSMEGSEGSADKPFSPKRIQP